MVFGDFDMIDENGRYMESREYDFSTKNIYHEFLRYCPESCTMLVRKKCFDSVGAFNVKYRYSQDHDMWLRIAAKCKVVHIGRTLGKKRIHASQLTRLGLVMRESLAGDAA